MASNTQTITDEDGEYSDWIEVMNIASTNVNLNGWALTDDSNQPRKWRFPSVELAPGETALVYASNKDRRIPGSPLHTDFRLSGNGDFLGLSNAEGMIVSHFGASYPAQLPDVSYGIVADEQKTVLVGQDASVQVLTPLDATNETSWHLVESPGGEWLNGTNGTGFDRSASGPALPWTATVLASAPEIFYSFDQPGVTTVTNMGSGGAIGNATAVGGLTYNQPGIRPPEMPGIEDTNVGLRFDGRDDYIATARGLLNDVSAFTMSAWIRPSVLNRPRTGLWGQHGVIEFGLIDDTLLQLASPAGGVVQTAYPFTSNEWHYVTASGDGETLRIYLDGVLQAEGGNNVPNYGSSLYPLSLGGSIFDPVGNSFNGFVDEFTFHRRALSPDEVAQLYQTAKAPQAKYAANFDLSTLVTNQASIYTRFPFVLAQTFFSGLVLRMQHDDGFAAYLNGVEIARENAPVELHWDSVAAGIRPGAVGLFFKDFDISASVGLLHEGTNILAIQLLNASGSDPDLFLRSELLGVTSRFETNSYRYFIEPTPGRLNGVGQTNLGPLVVNVKHSPELPGEEDPIHVTARMLPTFHPIQSLSLAYRVMFGAEVSVEMRDDGLNGDGTVGDGIYGATIPASAASKGQMVRWFLRASDQQGLVTRWPPYRDTRNSPQYLGTVIADSTLTNPLPVLHWFIQTPTGADSTAGSRCSVFWDGALYDNIFANLHGQSSQGFPKKSYNFDFNRGFKFQYSRTNTPVEDINLLTTYPDKAHMRNVLAYETFRDAGHAYHFVIPVRVQRNGVFFSDAHLVEDAEEEYLARVGLDPRGALYKMYNILDSATSNVEKKTRKYESNNDLLRLINGVNLSGAARNAFIYDNVDLPAMANYLAALIITGNVDCCHKNYYIYRDSAGKGEWQFLPWDVDLSFGRNWTGTLTYFDDTMYVSNPLFIGQNNRLPAALFGIPAFRQMYLRRLRTLMDELMQAPGTPAEELKYEKRIRELYAVLAPDAALDFAKWPTWGTKQNLQQAVQILTNQYMPGRRNFLFNTQRNAIPAPITNSLIINFGAIEFNPESGLQTQEYFTLVNTNRVAVDLSGWKIEGAVDYTFAPGMVLATNSSVYLSPDVNSFRLRSRSPRGGETLFVQGNYRGQLSARGETLVLKDKNGAVVSTRGYQGQPTLAQQFLRVAEVMFAPPVSTIPGVLTEDLEYIVLKNIGSETIDLDGISFDSGISFRLATNLFLAPSERVYLAKNPAAFARYYGSHQKWVVGPYLGQLSNNGETISLYDAVGEKVQDVPFENGWFPELQGRSLVSVADDTPYDQLEMREAWTASAYAGGSAGTELAWANWRAGQFASNPETGAPTADPDGDGETNYEEFILGTNPLDRASLFQVSAARDGSKLVLRFVAAPGRQYSIVESANLSEWRETQHLTRTGTAEVKEVRLESRDEPRSFLQIRAGL